MRPEQYQKAAVIQGPCQEWEEISVKMCHATLKKVCTLDGGFYGADGRRCATITGNHRPDKMGCRDWTPQHPLGDVTAIELTCNAPSWAPRARIPYLWIFEGAPEEEVGL